MSQVMLGIQNMMSWDDMWSLSIDFLNTANDIVCSRTDGKLEFKYQVDRISKTKRVEHMLFSLFSFYEVFN